MYQTFELDYTKYDLYGKAILEVLLTKKDSLERILLLGAGRGGLLIKILESLKIAFDVESESDEDFALEFFFRNPKKIEIFVVEKNPNCIPCLAKKFLAPDSALRAQLGAQIWKVIEIRILNKSSWEFADEFLGFKSNIYQNKKFDLIVSELLGSFGDNELSPECLFPIENLLKDNGRMIPKRYTSYLSLVSCQKVWDLIPSKEMSYTAFFARFIRAADGALEGFTFEHPSKENFYMRDKERSFEFTMNQEIMVHGVMGFFEAWLTDTVK